MHTLKRRVIPVLFLAVLTILGSLTEILTIGVTAYAADAGKSGVVAATPAYSAYILLRESGLTPKMIGSVTVAGGQTRLDVNLGAPGAFHAIVLPQRKLMYVLSDSLKGYAEIPIHGDETDMRALAARVAEAIMPFGVPVLTIREENRTELGTETWKGLPVRKSRSRFVTDFMGNTNSVELALWENDNFAPFPLRIVNLGHGTGAEDSVELTSISQGKALRVEATTFDLPGGYTRYGSVMDLLLFALTTK